MTKRRNATVKEPIYHDDNGRIMDAQMQHDAAMRPVRQTPKQVKMLKEYLARHRESGSLDPASDSYDPIALAMVEHPTLTRAEAEKFARLFGF